MKIGNTPGATGIGALNSATGGAREASTAGRNEAVSGSDSTKVTLSGAASALFDGTVDGAFDEEKVNRIRQSIADGTYQINHGAIADKLIANAQELLGKVSNN